MYCKKCGAAINDCAVFCTTCGARLDSTDNQENNERTSFEEQSPYSKNYTDKSCCFQNNSEVLGSKHRNSSLKIGTVVICVSAILLIILIFLFCKCYFDNKVALDLYDSAYSALYDDDDTYVSARTERLVDDAYKQSQSVFVLKGTKTRIATLKQTCDDYIKLNKAEGLMQGNPQDTIKQIREIINEISSDIVKTDNRYANIVSTVESLEYKFNNKSWAETKLAELKETNSDIIRSWAKQNVINFYTGSVRSGGMAGNDGFRIILNDYNGESHYLCLKYNFDSSSDWDANINKLEQILSSGKDCVMAAVTAVGYTGYERVFSYSYIYE